MNISFIKELMDTRENVSKMLDETAVGLKRDILCNSELYFRENLVAKIKIPHLLTF